MFKSRNSEVQLGGTGAAPVLAKKTNSEREREREAEKEGAWGWCRDVVGRSVEGVGKWEEGGEGRVPTSGRREEGGGREARRI